MIDTQDHCAAADNLMCSAANKNTMKSLGISCLAEGKSVHAEGADGTYSACAAVDITLQVH